MKILITTHQMADFAGSEIYTYELARALKAAGHTVTVYSRYIGSFEFLLAQAGIELVSNLKELADRTFDIAHVHHHINALEVRLHFPKLPIFFLSHGAKTFLENPPPIAINITRYGAVSDLVAKNLRRQGIPKSLITPVNNIVDDELYTEESPINTRIKKALIISNRMDAETVRRIESACTIAHIELTKVGSSFQRLDSFDIPAAINSVDVVFTIGRGVVEAMMCGRVPFVFDHRGGDGLMTPALYEDSAAFHFSGLYRGKKFTTTQIVRELKKYSPELGKKLAKMTKSRYGSKACVSAMEKIYLKTIAEYRPKKIDTQLLKYIVDTVSVTRLYTFSRTEVTGIMPRLKQFRHDMTLMVKSQVPLRFRKPYTFG